MPQFTIMQMPCQLLLLRISATRSYNKHFTFSHAPLSFRIPAKLRRNGYSDNGGRRLSKFFRRFIFAKRRFDFIEGRKKSPDAATPSPFCAISLLFRVNRRGYFDENKTLFLRLKLPKRAMEKRIFKKSYNR